MGSLVRADSTFDRLRRRAPEGSPHIVLFAKNREALDLLRIVPEANAIENDDRVIGRLAAMRFGTLRALWRLRPDDVSN